MGPLIKLFQFFLVIIKLEIKILLDLLHWWFTAVGLLMWVLFYIVQIASVLVLRSQSLVSEGRIEC